MAKRLHRVGALIGALLFLATTVGFSVLVVLQMRNGDSAKTSQNDVPQDVLDQLKAQQEANPLDNSRKLDNFTPVSGVSALQIIDLKEGTGEVVPEGGSVVAHYTGAIAATGVIFQTSHDSGNPIPFSLNGVIEGWTKGVPGMKVGGTRRLIIPAAQAYGANPPAGSGIPANADLVFDIELTALGD